VQLFENGQHTPEKQAVHRLETALFLERQLKKCLEKLAKNLFGEGEAEMNDNLQ
jgi:hypothetical protein